MNWNELKAMSLPGIIDWAETQSWCHAMKDCAQDPEWHAEGDVWSHTKMVLHELQALDEWRSLDPQSQTILIFTAIFHDVAKPLTTEVDPVTGRVRSPKHAVRGEHVARSVLRELECDLTTRETIARLVRYHGRPAFLMERDNPSHEVIRLSWFVNNRLLYLFALADTRGRDTDCLERPEENLHFWKMVAEENDCYEHPYPFATDHARFTYFRQTTPSVHYVPHDYFSCTVTMMAGLPGSGKDTWTRKHRSQLPVVSLDQIRSELEVDPTDNQGVVAQEGQERCRRYLRAGTDFVFNATNTLQLTRSRWLDLFADYRARIEIVYIEPPLRTLLRQNSSRTQVVPESVILRLASHCEPPTWLECHRLQVLDGTE